MEETQTTQIASSKNPEWMSADISQLAVALSEFQGSISQPGLEKEVKVKTKTGVEYKFKYADLAVCMKAAAPALKANGLAVSQIISGEWLITMLLHKSGQWIKSVIGIPKCQLGEYQSYGSALTYLKRYSYCSILGIVADTDDDANYAQGNTASMKDIRKAAQCRNSGEEIEKRALERASALTSTEEYYDLWNEYSATNPQICQNGTKFYNFMAKKRQLLEQ